MAFVYERVRPEDEELWNSIGWKSWNGRAESFSLYNRWCIDRERNACLLAIGGFIDMPDYYDFCYKGVIVRMEVSVWGKDVSEPGGPRRETLEWYIDNICIPESIWEDREEIVELIKEAFSVNTSAAPASRISSISVEIENEPKRVEADYNGR